MSGDRVMQDRASIEVDVSHGPAFLILSIFIWTQPGTYVELGGRNQFFTHPFWDDESNKIIAINNTNEEQQFALGQHLRSLECQEEANTPHFQELWSRTVPTIRSSSRSVVSANLSRSCSFL